MADGPLLREGKPGRPPSSRPTALDFHRYISSRSSSSATSSAIISRSSATAPSEPDRAPARSDSRQVRPIIQVAQPRRQAEQVQPAPGRRRSRCSPGRPPRCRQAVAQQRPAAGQPPAAGRGAAEPDDGPLGVVVQPPAQPGGGEPLVLDPVGEVGGVHAGVMLVDADRQHLAPPGAQGHLADQVALDGVAGPEVAGEGGLAAVDLGGGVGWQDDALAGEAVLAAVAAAAFLALGRDGPSPAPAVGPTGLGCAVLVFGPAAVFVIISVGSASAAVIGGSSSVCNGAVVVSRGLSAPGA